MRIFSLLICCLFTIFLAGAQNNKKAIEILERSADAFKNNTGIEASFLLKDGTNTPATHSFEGTLKSRSNKFVIDMPDMKTWFDGKTQWSYLKSNQEVNITSPSAEEVAAINPLSLIRLYKNGYRAIYKGERKIDGMTITEVELLAEKNNLNLRKIFIRFNTNTDFPVSVQIQDKNGRHSEINFLKIKQNLNFTDKEFVFNKNDFPEAEIIDLR